MSNYYVSPFFPIERLVAEYQRATNKAAWLADAWTNLNASQGAALLAAINEVEK